MKKILFFVAGFITINSFTPAPPQQANTINKNHPFAHGLLGCWPLNERGGKIAINAAGVPQENGALKNSAVFKTGTLGNCVSLTSASSDYVDFTNLYPIPPAVTVSVWVNFASLSQAYNSVVAKINTTGAFSYYQILVKSNGKVAMYVFGTASIFFDPGNITLVTGKWYNIVLTYSISSGLIGYVNGVLDASAAANGALVTGNNLGPLTVGADLLTAGRYVSGDICNLAVWNRALSKTEITQLYANPYIFFMDNN